MSRELHQVLRTRDTDYYRAKTAWSARLRRKQVRRSTRKSMDRYAWEWNVVGIGVGEKFAGEKPTGQPAVKFLVRHKPKRRTTVDKNLRLPKTIAGMPTDVQEVGRITLLQGPGHYVPGPLEPGSSVGFRHAASSANAGTLGALVQSRNGNPQQRFLLSNAHVLGDIFSQGTACDITFPGTEDSAAAATIGTFVPTAATAAFPVTGVLNRLDAALAAINPGTNPGTVIKDVGFIEGHRPIFDQMIVEKHGKSSQYTTGIVMSGFFDPSIPLANGDVLWFDDQIAIQPLHTADFCFPGDSGSLVLERDTNLAVGLLFARSETGICFANHIAEVLDHFQVDLVR